MLLGNRTEVRLEQFEKANFSIDFTFSPIVTDVKPEQFEKARSPIVATLLGMVMEVRALQPAKA
jgi:hypothetical protein